MTAPTTGGGRLRLAFMGSPDFAVPALRALHRAGHEIAAVYCQPPRPAGRGQRETRCPVHRVAEEELGLPVRTPAKLRRDAEEHARFAALDLDAAVVVAYGLLLPPPMLDAPRRGCVNIHASLLPRWRGAAPIHAAVLAGDAESITIMRMDEGLDTGPMLLARAVPIGPRATLPELHDALADLGARMVLEALAADPPARPQPEEGATVAPKLSKADGKLDWARDAAFLDRQVRAFEPWPGTFFEHEGATIRVLEAEPAPAGGSSEAAPGTVLDDMATVACGVGALRLLRLQRPGRAPMAAGEFLRGYALPAGTVLG